MAEYISFQPSDFFTTKLYTGTGAIQSITGVGFQPDFVWGKQRTDSGANYFMFDAPRGVTNIIESSSSAATTTDVNSLTAFGADGFTLGTDAQVNENLKTMVSWNWKAGTTTGITTDGSTTITPSAYSFDQTRGISIVKYVGNLTAGAKLAHGLGTTPSMVMVKMTNAIKDWKVYHKNMDPTSPQDSALTLNTATASVNELTYWNDTAPDSVNMTLGNSVQVNGSGDDYVAYCFTGKRGYSKFGKYKGWANSNGPFVNCGFRPAWVMIKGISNAWDWETFDNKRLGYNGAGGNKVLQVNNTSVEATEDIDILSNGFKIRDSGNRMNQSTYDYLYAAFAEVPIVSSNDVPGVAR